MSKCRTCGKEIVWLKTLRGKSMPVDAETVDEGEKEFNYKKHISHFATCNQPEFWRKKNEKNDQPAHNVD